MFEKLKLRTVKKDDILIAYPSKERIKVINIITDPSKLSYIDSNWLRRYWEVTHKIKLPKKYKIANCHFFTSKKDYYYPIVKVCVKKPLFQFDQRRMWKIDCQHLLWKREQATKKHRTIKEMDDNKGNWHPPSDYTMYKMGF